MKVIRPAQLQLAGLGRYNSSGLGLHLPRYEPTACGDSADSVVLTFCIGCVC